MSHVKWVIVGLALTVGVSAMAEPLFVRKHATAPVTLVTIEDDSGSLRDSQSPEPALASLHAFKVFVQDNYQSFDLASASDHVAFGVDGESAPETDVPAEEGIVDSRVTSIRQFIGGLEIADGNISVGYHADRLAVVQGRVFSASGLMGALGPVISADVVPYESARVTAKSGCSEFFELAPGTVFLSVRDARKHYRFICDIDEVQVNAVTGQVAARFRAAHGWNQTTTTMSSAADGSRLSGGIQSASAWIRYADLNTPPATQTLSGIRVAVEPINPEECRFRTQIVWPFPTTYKNSSPGFTLPFQVKGSCFGGAFVEPNTNEPIFHMANIHSQIERVAHIARLDREAGLFAVQRRVDDDALNVMVGVDPGPAFCWGQPGIYFTWGETICIRTDDYFASWATPVHEYGHYIMDAYGAGSTAISGCDSDAVSEGAADALMVSLLHRRYSAMSSITDAQRRTLFLNGPGNYRTQNGVTYTPIPNPRASALQECDNAYAKGMALSQVMWQLVNGLHCETFSSCNAPVDIVLQPEKRHLLPRLARRAFTLAITNNDVDDVYMLLGAWKAWLIRLLGEANALDTWSRSHVMLTFMMVNS